MLKEMSHFSFKSACCCLKAFYSQEEVGINLRLTMCNYFGGKYLYQDTFDSSGPTPNLWLGKKNYKVQDNNQT